MRRKADRMSGVLVAHRQVDEEALAQTLGQGVQECSGIDEERGAFVEPDFFVGRHQFLRSERHDDEVNQGPAKGRRHGHDLGVTEELA